MPGEFRDVESTGLDLGKSIVPLRIKKSQTLYQMLGFVATSLAEISTATDQVVSMQRTTVLLARH